MNSEQSDTLLDQLRNELREAHKKNAELSALFDAVKSTSEAVDSVDKAVDRVNKLALVNNTFETLEQAFYWRLKRARDVLYETEGELRSAEFCGIRWNNRHDRKAAEQVRAVARNEIASLDDLLQHWKRTAPEFDAMSPVSQIAYAANPNNR